MTLTTDQALAALRAADPGTGASASGVTADAVVARASQPRPESANLELHVAARRAPGRGHRLRTGLAVAATVVTLAGLAIAVTHGNQETVGPGKYPSGSITPGPIGTARPAWSILTGVTVATVAVSGRPTNAGADSQFIVASLNALSKYDGRYDREKCAMPTPALTVTLRGGDRVVAVARPGTCQTVSLTVPGHGVIRLMGAPLASIAFGLYGR